MTNPRNPKEGKNSAGRLAMPIWEDSRVDDCAPYRYLLAEVLLLVLQDVTGRNDKHRDTALVWLHSEGANIPMACSGHKLAYRRAGRAGVRDHRT